MKLATLLVATIAPLATLLPQFSPIANAQSNDQSIVRGRCNVEIAGLERGTRVNMRSGPGIKYRPVGYVLVGQSVNQLRYDIGATVIKSDDEAVNWVYVEYIPSRTRGWVAQYLLSDKCL